VWQRMVYSAVKQFPAETCGGAGTGGLQSVKQEAIVKTYLLN